MPTGKEVIAVSHFHLLNTELDTLGVSNKLVDMYYIRKNFEVKKLRRFCRSPFTYKTFLPKLSI